eukprot:scaffold620_cov169-Amphora_coffeaeformis.AAC.2
MVANDDTVTSHVSALREASVQWAQSLTEAARTINFAASDLQDDWADMSEAFQAQGEPALPDPIKLLRRIHALENSVRNLQQDCHAMMERRQSAVLRATDQLGILRDMCQNESHRKYTGESKSWKMRSLVNANDFKTRNEATNSHRTPY